MVSEELPATEFKNIPARGAVRFTLNPDAVEAAYGPSSRCLLAGRLAVDEILEFEQVEPWKTSLRFTAKLKVVPAGPLGEKALSTATRAGGLAGSARRVATDANPMVAVPIINAINPIMALIR